MINELITLIKARQAAISASLAQGGAASWDAYQNMVGQIQGLQTVLDAVDEKLEEDKVRIL